MGLIYLSMAVTFIKEQKKQRNLILVFAAVILITLFVLWQGVLKKSAERTPALKPITKEIKINFKVLESPILKGLQPFEEIREFSGKIGRENPFLPY